MNSEFYNLIEKAISSLDYAKNNIDARKISIINATQYVKLAMEEAKNNDEETVLYLNYQSISEQGEEQSHSSFSIGTKYEKVSPGDDIMITAPSSVSVPFMRIVEYDKDKNFVKLNWNVLKGNQIVFTMSDTTEYVRLSFKYTNENYLNKLYSEYTLYSMNYIKNEVPYISTYYIKPIVEPNEEVVIDYYISDYNRKEYTKGDYSDRFKVTVRVDGKNDIVVNNLLAGDHSISLGTFPNLDGEEQKFSIMCTDQYGRNSHELFNFFLVRNTPEVIEYIMTEEDLIKYNIKNEDDYEIINLIDTEITTVQNVYDNIEVPSNKYMIIAPSLNGELKCYTTDALVKYAEDYDEDKVEEESLNTQVGLQQFLDDKAEEGYNRVTLLKGVYRVSYQNRLYIPTNMTVDMNNSTLKLNQFTGNGCMMVSINNTFDSHVINGTIEGDYYTHDYENSENNSEWVNGIEISCEAKYSSFENIKVKNITGYGSGNGCSGTRFDRYTYTYIYPKGIGSFTYGDIDRVTGKDITGFDRTRSDFISTNGHENIGYASISKYLGYQGIPYGTSWNLVVYFYDENKNFIKATDTLQYRRFEVPSNARYLRVVILKESYPTDLNIHYFKIPTHCAFKKVYHENCRCVGMAQSAMNNMLVEDCEFVRCGYNSARCAYDAEDGWDMMQDVTFRRLNFHDNPNNEFLTCAGHNFIVEDMIDGKVYIWERTKNFVLRNSNCKTISLGYSEIERHGVYRIYNTTATGGSLNANIGRNLTVNGTMSGTLFDSSINGLPNSGTLTNCTMNISSSFIAYLGDLHLNNCIIKPVEGFNDRYNLSFNDTNHESTPVFNECKFYGKSKLANHNCFYDAEFNNCYFEDMYLEANVQGNEDEKIIFNNCNINSANDTLVRYTPHNYTVGNYTNVHFNNCNINSNTISTFAYAYSKPANGMLEINNCNMNLPNLNVIFDYNGSYTENIKDFHIKITDTELPCDKILSDKLESLKDVTIKID